MFNFGFELTKEQIRKYENLTKKWLKYYSNWEGNLLKRDYIIRKKVSRLIEPPKKLINQ